jgi:glycosyltransferase involved in cell wall biosynthesis
MPDSPAYYGRPPGDSDDNNYKIYNTDNRRYDGRPPGDSDDEEYYNIHDSYYVYRDVLGPLRTGRFEQSYPGGGAPLPARDPLRVIHVNVAMFPAGIDKWLTALVRCSDPRRVKFLRCVVTGDHIDRKQIARVGVPVEIGRRDSIRRACEDCDVLLVSDPGETPDWVEDVQAKLCVFVAHGEWSWSRARLDWMAAVVHHVVAVSSGVQRAVCGGYPSTVIPNGVDPRHLTRSRPRVEVRASLGFRPDDFVLGFVGRFAPEKNPFAVIEAVARLPLHFKLLLVGYGPLRDALIERANLLIPGRYEVIRGEDDLGDLYAAMDAFCLVSHTEGFGLVIMEAMMCGKPVIVGNVGMVPDVITDRVNGMVVRGDAESIREAASLLDAHPDWAACLGREAFRYAEGYGFASTMADRYADLLESLWAARTSGRSPG